MISKTLLILLLLTILRGFSQGYTKLVYNVPENQWIKINFSSFTSLVVEQENDWEESWIILDKDTIELKQDIHFSKKVSQQIFSNSLQEIWMKSVSKQNITFHLFFAKSKKHKIARVSENSCSLPQIITPSEWRGNQTIFPPPKVKPTATSVQHVIIHHAATSNSYTDYYGTVQNIYLYHTQTNGWDDIGYNYLIAPDGTIFQGRDGQNIDDADNIRGAHMCNKNNYTMAICLLGTYTNVKPNKKMLSALENLITWKLIKENIDPLGESVHAIGPTSANLPNDFLPHIAGHRDGCQTGYTECPGQKVYDLLPELRENINTYKNTNTCVSSTINYLIEKKYKFDNHILLFEEKKDCILIYDINGHLIEKVENQQMINTESFSKGMYLVKVVQNNQIQFIKIIKI